MSLLCRRHHTGDDAAAAAASAAASTATTASATDAATADAAPNASEMLPSASLASAGPSEANGFTISSPCAPLTIPESTPLPEFVFAAMRGVSYRTALVDGVSGRAVTYGELETGARRLAQALAGGHGVGKGTVVCIFSPNDIEYPVAFHGVALTGGVVTTANPTYSAEELAHQMRDSGASLLITIAPLADKVEAARRLYPGIREVFVFGSGSPTYKPLSLLYGPAAVLPSPAVALPAIDPRRDLVCLPYSSGTTSLPKGVELTHYNLVANILQTASLCPELAADDVFVGVLPFFHIYGMMVVLNLALYKRVPVVSFAQFDLERFLAAVQRHRITALHLVPPIILALARHPLVAKYDLSSVRVVMSGAAPLGEDLQNEFQRRFPRIVCKQAYGMTELSPATHINPTDANRLGSVGVLVANCECRVVDLETGRPLPPGGTGELCIRGPNVMRGYLNKPDQTRQMIDADGFLHTGDVGRVDRDGYFFVVDRVKELIKYKGFQVPPAQLEDLLLSHPAVADAAVVPLADEEAGELPAAFVVLKAASATTTTTSAQEIADFVAAKVAPHKKLRGGVYFVDKIPKSASGKILRRLLRDELNSKKKSKQATPPSKL